MTKGLVLWAAIAMLAPLPAYAQDRGEGGFYYYCRDERYQPARAAFYSRIMHDSGRTQPTQHMATEEQDAFALRFEAYLAQNYGFPAGSAYPFCSEARTLQDARAARQAEIEDRGWAYTLDIYPATSAEAGPVSKAEAAKPRSDPASWITNDDYPALALRRGEYGTVGVALFVEASGRVSDCRVRQPSGSDSLDEVTCALFIRRGRFDPALDASGTPKKGSWTGEHTWILPSGER